jgi:hypothetical protein
VQQVYWLVLFTLKTIVIVFLIEGFFTFKNLKHKMSQVSIYEAILESGESLSHADLLNVSRDLLEFAKLKEERKMTQVSIYEAILESGESLSHADLLNVSRALLEFAKLKEEQKIFKKLQDGVSEVGQRFTSKMEADVEAAAIILHEQFEIHRAAFGEVKDLAKKE